MAKDTNKSIVIYLTILCVGVRLSYQDETLAARYLLPRESFPSLYDVRLYLDPDSENFYGNVSIRVIPYIDTNEIVLHADGLDITYARVYNERNPEEDLFAGMSLATDDTHLLRIGLSQQIGAVQPHIVDINYVGSYTYLYGIYLSSYEHPDRGTVNLVVSQFAPTYARRALPCYDEPAMKSIFRTTIYAPPNYPTVLSNMPERAELLKEDVDGYLKYEFEDTPIMSTYLLAYLVSDFDYVSNENDVAPEYRVPFRVYSEPGTQETGLYAVDFGQRNMAALEAYVGYPYSISKLDNVAIPDFAFGAMENWGLIVYREPLLLEEVGVTTTAQKHSITTIISHENAHQWFGNEVSPLSWTFTWLNEGFARFFENFASELVQPDWRFMDWSVVQMHTVFQQDAEPNVFSMNHEAFTPSEIMGKFNFVNYGKAGSVIRMMHHFITPEVFQSGMAKFIQNNAKRAVSPAALYVALQEAINESGHTIPYTIASVLDNWASQPGFPLLTVRRTAPTANSLFVSQERFLTNRSVTSSGRWIVPINWVLSTDVDFSDTRAQSWIPTTYPAPSINIPGLSEAEWFIINKQQTGYYRVNYDVENWQALARVLSTSHETIHGLNRAQLIDDSFNLARNGRLNYIQALEISRYLVEESDCIPWSSANGVLSYVTSIVRNTPQLYEPYKNYLLSLTAPLYQSLGFQAAQNEAYGTVQLRTIILNINCDNGNEDCWETASQLLQPLKTNPSQSLDPDIKDIVYCSSLRNGDSDNYNFLWGELTSSTDQTDRSALIRALGCTSNAELRETLLNEAIADNSQLRDSERAAAIQAVANASPDNLDVALEFFIDNFEDIKQRVTSISTTALLNTFAQRLTSSAQLQRFEEFIEGHQSTFTAGELNGVEAVRSSLAASISWTDSYGSVLESWLSENYETDDAYSIKSGLLVVLSVIAVLYNESL